MQHEISKPEVLYNINIKYYGVVHVHLTETKVITFLCAPVVFEKAFFQENNNHPSFRLWVYLD